MARTTWQQKIAALRGRVMKRLVDEVTTAFAKHHSEILMGQLAKRQPSTILLGRY